MPFDSKNISNLIKRKYPSLVDSDIVVLLLAASWCPHCMMFKKTWTDLEDISKTNSNLKLIQFDDSEIIKEKAGFSSDFGYPTVLFCQAKKVSEFSGERNVKSILSELKDFSTNEDDKSKIEDMINVLHEDVQKGGLWNNNYAQCDANGKCGGIGDDYGQCGGIGDDYGQCGGITGTNNESKLIKHYQKKAKKYKMKYFALKRKIGRQ